MSSQLSPDTESLLILIYVFLSSVLITSLTIVFAFRILTGIPDYLIAHKNAKTIKEKQIKKTQKQKAKITNDNDTATITGGGNHKKSDKEFVSATGDKSVHTVGAQSADTSSTATRRNKRCSSFMISSPFLRTGRIL